MTMISHLVCDWCGAEVQHQEDHAEIIFVSRETPMIDNGLRHACQACTDKMLDAVREEQAS